VDTSVKRRRRWAVEAKRRIAEESFEGSSSVAELSQKYGVNANQIFQWRKRYREGGLGKSSSTNLLPVTVRREMVVEAESPGTSSRPVARSLKIEVSKGTLRISGSVDLGVLRTALECLLG
jgi:transposase